MDIKKIFKNRSDPCGICEDMVLLFLMTLCYAAVCYEGYMPKSFMIPYKAVVTLFFAGSWICVSFKNGFLERWQNLVFSVLFWTLPQLLIYLANDGPRALRMSVAMYVISEFAVFISSVPGTLLGGVLGLNELFGAVASGILCAAVFVAGVLFSAVRKKKSEPEEDVPDDPVPVRGTRFKPSPSAHETDD